MRPADLLVGDHALGAVAADAEDPGVRRAGRRLEPWGGRLAVTPGLLSGAVGAGAGREPPGRPPRPATRRRCRRARRPPRGCRAARPRSPRWRRSARTRRRRASLRRTMPLAGETTSRQVGAPSSGLATPCSSTRALRGRRGRRGSSGPGPRRPAGPAWRGRPACPAGGISIRPVTPRSAHGLHAQVPAHRVAHLGHQPAQHLLAVVDDGAVGVGQQPGPRVVGVDGPGVAGQRPRPPVPCARCGRPPPPAAGSPAPWPAGRRPARRAARGCRRPRPGRRRWRWRRSGRGAAARRPPRPGHRRARRSSRSG